MSGEPWSRCENGALIRVRLTPKSLRDELCGVEQLSDGGRVFKARVRAAPKKGEANAALFRLVAVALKVSRSDVSLASGGASRLKTLKIKGDPASLADVLARLATEPAAA